MTGGTSRFGAVAAERMLRPGDVRLVHGARRPAAAGEQLPLDLAALDSVRSFAAAVRDRTGDTPVDVLVLNAGMILPDVDGRSADGVAAVPPQADAQRPYRRRERPGRPGAWPDSAPGRPPLCRTPT